MKIWIGVFLALSAVNSYGALNFLTDTNKGYSQSAVNNVSKYYKALDIPAEDKRYLEYRKSSEKVEIVEGGESENILVQSQGYRPIGYSEFQDRALPDSAFIEQAHKIGAQKVLVHKQGTTAVPYYSDDDLNNLDHGYYYYVLFYVKNGLLNQPNTLGLNMVNIPLEKTKLYQRNTGAYVVSVIQNSRAYTSNIIIEDVITAINDKKVLKVEDFNPIKEAELKKSKTLNLTIIRLINNEPKEIQIPVSFN